VEIKVEEALEQDTRFEPATVASPAVIVGSAGSGGGGGCFVSGDDLRYANFEVFCMV
jgi:hypothetical protein